MSRRANNEGSVYKRKDGRWCAVVYLKGERIYLYARTRTEVVTKLKETQKQVDQGLTVRGARYSLGEYLQEWLVFVKSNLRPHTWEGYEQVTRSHIVPHLGTVRLKDLHPKQIQALYALKEKSLGPSTIRIIHAVLHKSLDQAIKWGLIGRNPADAVTRPRQNKKEMSVLTPEQAQSLLSHLVGDRYEALYYLALTTGLRRGELLGLKWDDLDWVTGKLKVQRQLSRLKGEGLVFMQPKTRAGQRSIALGQGALEKLRNHAKLQQLERQFFENRWKDTGLIFTSLIGTPIDPKNLSNVHSKLIKDLGFPPIRFHDLRHTAATLMLIQGVHPKVVQERLGHSTIEMTLNTYSHVLPSLQDEAAAKIEELLTPIPVQLNPVERK